VCCPSQNEHVDIKKVAIDHVWVILKRCWKCQKIHVFLLHHLRHDYVVFYGDTFRYCNFLKLPVHVMPAGRSASQYRSGTKLNDNYRSFWWSRYSSPSESASLCLFIRTTTFELNDFSPEIRHVCSSWLYIGEVRRRSSLAKVRDHTIKNVRFTAMDARSEMMYRRTPVTSLCILIVCRVLYSKVVGATSSKDFLVDW